MTYDDCDWCRIPGRKVLHAFVGDNILYSVCGHSTGYQRTVLTKPENARRCEQCMIVLVTNINIMDYKRFIGYEPIKIKRKRRKLWKKYLDKLNGKN